jgi:8-oxo-dGTP pyrophosphatase MutT (NUDIX family)
MNNSNKLIGKIFFWLLWPGLYVYLRNSSRSRVIIHKGRQILLISNWLGPGQYTLTGGGIRRGERPDEAAAREIKEETGITIEPNSLAPIKPMYLATDKGLKYQCYSFSLKVDEATKLSRQKFEIAELRWVDVGDVLSKYQLNTMAKQLITTWLDNNHLLD